MRYVAAISVSLAIVATIWILMMWIERLENKRRFQGFIAAKERGDIPADADINTAAFGTEVLDLEVVAFGTLRLWKNFRILLIPLIITSAVAIAWYLSAPNRN